MEPLKGWSLGTELLAHTHMSVRSLYCYHWDPKIHIVLCNLAALYSFANLKSIDLGGTSPHPKRHEVIPVHPWYIYIWCGWKTPLAPNGEYGYPKPPAHPAHRSLPGGNDSLLHKGHQLSHPTSAGGWELPMDFSGLKSLILVGWKPSSIHIFRWNHVKIISVAWIPITYIYIYIRI
jgi:hypothetical protein